MTKAEVLQKLTRDLEMRGRSIETIKEYTTKVRLFQVMARKFRGNSYTILNR